MIPWAEAKVRAGCACKMSDAWRCARYDHLPTIACHCSCHNYVRLEPAQPVGGPDA